MANFMIIKKDYDTIDALKNVFEYISDKIKSDGLIGAQNMLVDYSFEQAMAVNRYFYNNTGKKVIHFILSFAIYDNIDPIDAFYEGYKACELLSEYQIKFAIHQNKDNLHIHFAMNPISINDGHKFYFDDSNLYKFITGLRKIFEPYGIKINYIPYDNSNDSMFSDQLNYSA